MSRLIESIRLQDGNFSNLFYHEQRMAHGLKELYGKSINMLLEKTLAQYSYPQQGLYKCRILYDDMALEVTFTAYEAKPISRIRVVEDDEINYGLKFEDREHIDRLVALRNGCDDVLIIKEGKVTDCSFSNVVFRKGDVWFTPSAPLLKGTMREKLIDEKLIHPSEIHKDQIRDFDSCKIINAMLEFDSPEIAVSNIVF